MKQFCHLQVRTITILVVIYWSWKDASYEVLRWVTNDVCVPVWLMTLAVIDWFWIFTIKGSIHNMYVNTLEHVINIKIRRHKECKHLVLTLVDTEGWAFSVNLFRVLGLTKIYIAKTQFRYLCLAHVFPQRFSLIWKKILVLPSTTADVLSPYLFLFLLLLALQDLYLVQLYGFLTNTHYC